MDAVEKFQEFQEWLEDKFGRIGKGKYARLLKMARKPTTEEYVRVAEITGFGIFLIGIIGFIIYMIMSVYFPVP
ncbi:MAG: protein translocase SEC61 complex subunit gamma [Thermoplasmata archaeon]